MSTDRSNQQPHWYPSSSTDSPPPSLAVHVDFGAASRQGPRRATNDDHYLIVRLGRQLETILTNLPESDAPPRFDEYGYGMVVADGLGRSGAVASRLAITTLVHLAIQFGRWNVRIDEPIAQEVMDRVERFYRGIDSTLAQEGRHNNPAGLQTTLTGVFTAGRELFFAHVGHSRAYLFRDGELLQLTHDDLLARERPRKAALVDVTSRARDLQHILTDAMGMAGPSSPRIDIERCGLLDGDLVLLCTNGLTDVVDDTRIAAALQVHRTPEEQCRALVDLATTSGATDDTTVVVAQYRIPE